MVPELEKRDDVHFGFLEVPRLCSKKSQVGVKNSKLIKNEKIANTTSLEQ